MHQNPQCGQGGAFSGMRSSSCMSRSAVLEQRLKDIFGFQSMQELLAEMPDEWPGRVVGVRVERDPA